MSSYSNEDKNFDHLPHGSLPHEEEDAEEIFDIDNTTGIKTVKGALNFMRQGLRAHTLETDKKLDQIRNMLQDQSNATTEAVREFRNLIIAQRLESKTKSHASDIPPQGFPRQSVRPKSSVEKFENQDILKEEATSSHDKYLSALSATMMRLEAKIDNLEATRPNGFSAIKKLAPDNMPGPRRPNNLLNCQDLKVEDLSNADTPTYEIYVKSIWPEALSSGEVNEELRLPKNATHKFSCMDNLTDASADNWQRLHNIQRSLFNEMTPYRFWPSRIVGNISGDFEAVAKFIRYKNPTWLLTIEAILTIMRNYNGVQPPISQLASIKKDPEEGDLQFLRRVRTIFNRMPLNMSQSSVAHEVLRHSLRKYVPHLWARVEDRGLADISSEALETTIELAAQNFQIYTSRHLTNNVSNLISYGRDEIMATEETNALDDVAFPVETDLCYKCGRRGHWSRSCPNKYSQNFNRPSANKQYPANQRGRGRGAITFSHNNHQNFQQYTTRPQHQRHLGKPTHHLTTRGKGKHHVFATEEEMLLAENSNDQYYEEGNLSNTEDDYLHNYIQEEFNSKHLQDFEINTEEVDHEKDIIYLTEDSGNNGTSYPPDREGSNQSHPLFKAIVNGVNSTIFLDYGSNSSWVCESRIVESATFPSSNPTVIKGLGHKPAATITRDSIVNVKLPNGESFGPICCGVVPDNLFPGQLVLGRSLFHTLG
ncbi:hypothetical protein Golomagni_06248, partial [Golovinomyces magnicellulatus]